MMSFPPTSSDDLWKLVLVLAVTYLLAGFLISLGRRCPWKLETFVIRLFDCATFSASTMLLLAIWSPDVMRLIGDTKPFLLISGLAGTGYGLYALQRN